MRLLVGLGVLALCTVPVQAQSLGGSHGGRASGGSGGFINSSSGSGGASFAALPANPATEFRMTVATGSGATFVPSAFLPYEMALEEGDSTPGQSVFMTYRQAVAAGIAELDGKPISVAQAAQENRRKAHAKTSATFVQDQFGRVIRQAN
jgi:hypothetical protein